MLNVYFLQKRHVKPQFSEKRPKRFFKMTEPTNFILYIQLTGYCIAAILSLCVTIPMSMHQDNFKVSHLDNIALMIIFLLTQGHCLLFTTGEWRAEDGQFVVDWASQAYCNFTIFVGVVMFVISATQVTTVTTSQLNLNTKYTMMSRFTE